MRHKLVALCAAALMASAPVIAQEEEETADFLGGNFSANVAVTTDYTFRGISQSSTDAAVQGGIDWASDLFYVGFWGSTVDFNDDLVNPFNGEIISDGASTELDFYAGITPTVGDVGLSFGVVYYFYPDAPQDDDDIIVPDAGPFLVDPADFGLAPGDVFLDFPQQDYVELQAGAAYDIGPASFGLTLSWSPEYYFEAGNSLHTLVDGSLPIGEFDLAGTPASLSVSGHAAYLEFFEDDEAASTGFFEDYWEFGIGATLTVWGIDLDARYIDTASLAGNGSTGVFTISKSF